MKHLTGVYMTTDKALDGSFFYISEIEKAYSESFSIGNITCLGHDSTMPIGHTLPTSLSLSPGKGRLLGMTVLAETEEEQKQINSNHRKLLDIRLREDIRLYRDKLTPLIESSIEGVSSYLSTGMFFCHNPGILKRHYSSLMGKVDKNGLLYLKDILEAFEYLGFGIFKDKKSPLAISVHSYFRRSLSRHNNVNYYFLEEFMKLSSTPEIIFRIRLDEDMVGLAESFREPIEYEHWRGPMFDNDVSKVKYGVSEYRMDQYNRIFNKIDRTEFWWKDNHGEHTFEAEEIRDAASLGVSSDDYGCRYSHAIFDLNNDDFEHFDGAVRMYDTEKMLERLDSDIKSAGKNSIYTKLFRIDKKLPIKDWKFLLAAYFQGNPLVEEYLNSQDGKSIPETNVVHDNTVESQISFIPPTFKEGDGVHISITYQGYSETEHADIPFVLKGHDVISTVKIVEIDVIEIKKALLRAGYLLKIPSDFQFLDFENTEHWNIPCIHLGTGLGQQEYMNALLGALHAVIASDCHLTKTISLTISWDVPEASRSIVCSVAGYRSDLLAFLTHNKTIPVSVVGLAKWITHMNKWLTDFRSSVSLKPFAPESDGALYLKRTPLLRLAKDGEITFKDGTYLYELKEEYRKYFEYLQNFPINRVFHVKATKCDVCQLEYLNCPHSMNLDGTGYRVVDMTRIGEYLG
jgi:hypothetical protein